MGGWPTTWPGAGGSPGRGRGGVRELAGPLRRRPELGLLKLTPAQLELLAEELGPAEVRERAWVLVVGGEELSRERAGWWQKQAPGCRLVNEYGPTETVVGCSIYRLEGEAGGGGGLAIGRPVANSRIYVLNRELA